MTPLVIELFCGSFGWSHGWLERGGRAVGFDLEHLPHHGPVPPNADLVLQDVRTLHGAQFRDAELILASPPCQFFSRMAMPFKMPWKQEEFGRRRTLAHDLFWQPWRIQHEASEAAGREIPLIVENVCGAQKWVGRSRYTFGSFHLWGDLPALMPAVMKGVMKSGVTHRANGETNFHGSANRAGLKGAWDNSERGKCRRTEGIKNPAETRDEKYWLTTARKVPGLNWSDPNKPAQGFNVTTAQRYRANQSSANALLEAKGIKQGGNWWHDPESMTRKFSSRSDSRKAASAAIARIPEALSRWIAEVYWP